MMMSTIKLTAVYAAILGASAFCLSLQARADGYKGHVPASSEAAVAKKLKSVASYTEKAVVACGHEFTVEMDWASFPQERVDSVVEFDASGELLRESPKGDHQGV